MKKRRSAKAVKDDNPASKEDVTRITEGVKKIREASGHGEHMMRTRHCDRQILQYL